MVKIDEIYMYEALKEARNAALEGEVPVGCVIVRDRKIIARANIPLENRRRTFELLQSGEKFNRFLSYTIKI